MLCRRRLETYLSYKYFSSAVEDLKPISLTSIKSNVQESYVTDWLYEDVGTKVNKAQYGGIPASSVTLVNLVHKWYWALEEHGKVIRIIFLHVRKAFDLIEHNKLLENFEKIGIRPALISWVGSYLRNRIQVTKFG